MSQTATHKSDVVFTHVVFSKSDVIFNKSYVVFIKLDVVFNKSDVVFIKSDVAFIKSDVVFIKSDVVFNKSDVVFNKSDVIFIKSDVVFNKSDIIFNFSVFFTPLLFLSVNILMSQTAPHSNSQTGYKTKLLKHGEAGQQCKKHTPIGFSGKYTIKFVLAV